MIGDERVGLDLPAMPRILPLAIAADHPAYAGHFPGQPLLPGVSLLAEVLEAVLRQPDLAALIGRAPSVPQVKFLAPVRPGDPLSLLLTPPASALGRLGFEIRRGDRVVATGQFAAGSPLPAPAAG